MYSKLPRKLGIVALNCIEAQNKVIENNLTSGYKNTKEIMLNRPDYCEFFSLDVVQHQYANNLYALNKLTTLNILVKTSVRKGGGARYAFSKNLLEELIDNILNKNGK